MFLLAFLLAGSASVPRRYAVHLAEWLPYDRMGSIGAALTIVGVLILIARFFAGVANGGVRGRSEVMTRGFPVLLGLVLTIGMAALAFETNGFRVVTSAGARQLAVERQPLALQDVRLRDQNDSIFSLSDYRGRPLLVDFIYARCPTLCMPLLIALGVLLAGWVRRYEPRASRCDRR